MLKELFKDVDRLKDYMTKNNLDEKVFAQIIKDIEKHINDVQKTSEHDIHNCQCQLLRVHLVFTGKFPKLHLHTRHIQTLRKLHDKLFHSLSIKKPSVYFNRLPTYLFTTFMRGITYFTHEIANVPVYHRNVSCGEKTKTFTEKFVIQQTNSNVSAKKKKAIVKLCFIERKVYDMIYQNTIHEQDLGHLYELKNVERLFEQYHPGENLTLKIEYDDDDCTPRSLHIITIKKSKIIDESYTKLKNGMTYCIKHDFDGQVYEKYQTNDEEEPWMIKKTS